AEHFAAFDGFVGRDALALVGLVGRIQQPYRLACELAGAIAQDFLVAPVAANDRAVAKEHEADDAAIEDELLLGVGAAQIVRRHVFPSATVSRQWVRPRAHAQLPPDSGNFSRLLDSHRAASRSA